MREDVSLAGGEAELRSEEKALEGALAGVSLVETLLPGQVGH